MKPSDKTKFTRLAHLKAQQKELKVKVDKLAKELQVDFPDINSMETKYGRLGLVGRDTLEMDNMGIAKEMGVDEFIAQATISKTKIAKFGGDRMLSELFDRGAIVLKSTSYSFKLYKGKSK